MTDKNFYLNIFTYIILNRQNLVKNTTKNIYMVDFHRNVDYVYWFRHPYKSLVRFDGGRNPFSPSIAWFTVNAACCF